MEQLITTSDAARLLNRSADRVRDYEREGKLPAQKTPGGQRLFKTSDVERLAKELGAMKKST
ncbi:MAG: helix-turn-helix domain-containing protein [Nitrospira sp.]|nr:helix-turn-helix domain-containing protein [Nitrospira sp.]